MPQKIFCEDCNEVLYDNSELATPEEIISKYNGKCPKCGKKLEFNTEKIEIKVLKI